MKTKEKLKIAAILIVPIVFAIVLFFGILHIDDVFKSYTDNIAADDAGNIYIGFVGGLRDKGHIDVVDKDGGLLRRIEVECGSRGYSFVLSSDKIYCESARGYLVVDLYGNAIDESPSEMIKSLLSIKRIGRPRGCTTSDGTYYIDDDLFGFEHVYRENNGKRELFY